MNQIITYLDYDIINDIIERADKPLSHSEIESIISDIIYDIDYHPDEEYLIIEINHPETDERIERDYTEYNSFDRDYIRSIHINEDPEIDEFIDERFILFTSYNNNHYYEYDLDYINEMIMNQ